MFSFLPLHFTPFSKIQYLHFQISALTGTSPHGNKVCPFDNERFFKNYSDYSGNYPIPESMKGEYDVSSAPEEKPGDDAESGE